MSADLAVPALVLAWHFVGSTLRDKRPVPPDGETLRHDGPLDLCVSGLHASERIIDALGHAEANTICRVRCGGEMLRDDDKLVCRERTILWRFDAGAVLREFARACALDVAHLWNAPAVVLDYLRTGNEDLRAAARAATRAAARAAAHAAARDAAHAAAHAAARDAAHAAARDAAWAAAQAAAQAAQNAHLETMVRAAAHAEELP